MLKNYFIFEICGGHVPQVPHRHDASVVVNNLREKATSSWLLEWQWGLISRILVLSRSDLAIPLHFKDPRFTQRQVNSVSPSWCFVYIYLLKLILAKPLLLSKESAIATAFQQQNYKLSSRHLNWHNFVLLQLLEWRLYISIAHSIYLDHKGSMQRRHAYVALGACAPPPEISKIK